MGNVLTETKALNVLTDGLVTWIGPLLSSPLHRSPHPLLGWISLPFLFLRVSMRW